ncbi:Uncharacterized protein dnm_053730 [Desulfonema magnum]|uniref:Uncharacterized protein n=1 Tax=Desulfonema magnum TaxID=45655 RepID=A0A975GQU5_9BACT|nr:Uncharacterized protein dnm_053730 [Desulfonema magnum]
MSFRNFVRRPSKTCEVFKTSQVSYHRSFMSLLSVRVVRTDMYFF